MTYTFNDQIEIDHHKRQTTHHFKSNQIRYLRISLEENKKTSSRIIPEG